jgi:hypothetical protein
MIRLSDLQQEPTYTPLFCEENIWLLANRLRQTGQQEEGTYVLFFSNLRQSILLLNQRRASEGRLTLWDYHVVLQTEEDERTWIYDFDSRLPFPTRLQHYFSQTFPDPAVIPKRYQTKIRQIPVTEYLTRFSSDRSHMTGILEPERFPRYPCIMPPASSRPIPLSSYRDMRRKLDDHSRVFDLLEYCNLYGV